MTTSSLFFPILLGCVVPVVCAYLLGSVSFGLIIAKTFCNIDPRTAGSNNVGATNVARLCGVPYGVLTLFCDLGKGFLPVILLRSLPTGVTFAFMPMLVGIAAVLGHMFPIFLHFKGGKGVATTVGVFLALAPVQLAIAGLVCILIIWRTRFVSAGSLTLVALLPVLFLIDRNMLMLTCSVVLGVFVAVAHRQNIRRLLKGEEKAWISKKNEKN